MFEIYMPCTQVWSLDKWKIVLTLKMIETKKCKVKDVERSLIFLCRPRTMKYKAAAFRQKPRHDPRLTFK